MTAILWLAWLAQLDTWKALPPVTLQTDVHHVQGIDVEGGVLWVSSVDKRALKGYLSRFDVRTGKLLAQVEVQEGARFHPGGLTLDGDSVWIPVAEYDRDGPTTMQRRDKKTLALRGQFPVEDHIGCVAAGTDGLIGGNWDSKVLYRWTRAGVELSRTPNPGRTSYQDLKLVRGELLGSGNVSAREGAVEWLRLPDFQLLKRLEAGATDRGVPYTHEGMTLRNGRLYLLPEDAPSRLFTFVAP
ncbi:MAG: hypothetical protein K2X03_25810 [Bryobacteraceae bacterium]|nr:hypothetical protein [Bryobacteraceae bacterium]